MSSLRDERSATPASMTDGDEPFDFPDSPSSNLPALGKRKRDDEDVDGVGDDNGDHIDNFETDEDTLFIPDWEHIPPADLEDEDIDQDETGEGDGQQDEVQDEDEVADRAESAYDQSSESFPACAYYHVDVPNISQRLLEVPQMVLDVLAKHKSNGRHVCATREAAQKLLTIPRTRKQVIGLLGDAGAGKSSLLNSLADQPDLAKSLSGGQSCTCVPTEYTDAFPEQRKDYAARITYFDITRIEKFLGEMLSDYNIFTFEKDRSWDEDIRTAYKKAMQNALNTFIVLFCDLPEFKDQAAAKTFLELSYKAKNGKAKAITMFMESCEKKLKRKISLGGQYREFVEASTRTKFREVVDPLMGSKRTGGQPALWPLVMQVCIGVRGSRVLDKLTIVDLPGISDTNSTRVDFTKQYIRTRCDGLWIVAPIRRVVDDGSVYSLLSMYGKIFKDKMMVICTHNDDGVDRKLAHHLEDENYDVAPYFELTEELKAKSVEATQQNAKITALKNRKKPTKANLEAIIVGQRRLKDRRKEYLEIESRRFAFLVAARAENVSTQLREDMQCHLPDGCQLEIHCVSNSHYAALKKVTKIDGPRLDANATGIPALRAAALALAAPNLMRDLVAHMTPGVTSFLESSHMWVNTTSVERRAETMELINGPQKALSRRLRGHQKDFEKKVKDSVAQTFQSQSKRMLEIALQKLNEKRKKHPSTNLAFVRKYGKHSTKVCPKEAWNEHFSQAILDIVATSSTSWSEGFNASLEASKNIIIADFRRILAELEKSPSAKVLPMAKFRELIDSQVVGIENVFSHHAEEYERGLRAVFLDMTQDSAQNYFSRTMKPIYGRCIEDSGAGIVKRSLDRIEQHLKKKGSSSPFDFAVRSGVKAIMLNDKLHVKTRLQPRIDELFSDTYDAFDRMIDRTVEDPDEREARLDLKAHIEQIHEKFHAVRLDLDAIRAELP